MFFPEQDQFYRRWLAKADAIVGDDVIHLIDRFITLFINYNALYNLVPIKIAWRDGRPMEEVGDKKGATTSMRDFLTVPVITQYLTQERLDAEILNLATAIEIHGFHIKIRNGIQQPEIDLALVQGLRSATAKTKITALLETLYYIRCNIFHGEKALTERQVHLLQPATRLLRGILVLAARQIERMTV